MDIIIKNQQYPVLTEDKLGYPVSINKYIYEYPVFVY
jgi:hypothetical protein